MCARSSRATAVCGPATMRKSAAGRRASSGSGGRGEAVGSSPTSRVLALLPKADDEAIIVLDEVGVRAIVRQHALHDLPRYTETGGLDIAVVSQHFFDQLVP